MTQAEILALLASGEIDDPAELKRLTRMIIPRVDAVDRGANRRDFLLRMRDPNMTTDPDLLGGEVVERDGELIVVDADDDTVQKADKATTLRTLQAAQKQITDLLTRVEAVNMPPGAPVPPALASEAAAVGRSLLGLGSGSTPKESRAVSKATEDTKPTEPTAAAPDAQPAAEPVTKSDEPATAAEPTTAAEPVTKSDEPATAAEPAATATAAADAEAVAKAKKMGKARSAQFKSALSALLKLAKDLGLDDDELVRELRKSAEPEPAGSEPALDGAKLEALTKSVDALTAKLEAVAKRVPDGAATDEAPAEPVAKADAPVLYYHNLNDREVFGE